MNKKRRTILITLSAFFLFILSACSTYTQNISNEVKNKSDVHLKTGAQIQLYEGSDLNHSMTVTYIGENVLELSKRMNSERSEVFTYNIEEGTVFTFPVSDQKAKVIKIEPEKNEVTISFNND